MGKIATALVVGAALVGVTQYRGAGAKSADCPMEAGGTLYLDRKLGDIETLRAKFCYAQDCRLLAASIQRQEPRVAWYCK